MRVLVVEHEHDAAAAIIDGLREAGHDAVTCHEAGVSFPCVGITATCPMQAGVDVTLVVRTPGATEPSILEDGVGCSIREHVPVVVAGGVEASNPFAQWTVEFVDADVSGTMAAVVRAGEAPHAELSEVASAAARRVLVGAVECPTATVYSSKGGFKAIVEIDGSVPDADRSRVATWVLTALRAELDNPKSIDVSVVRTSAHIAEF